MTDSPAPSPEGPIDVAALADFIITGGLRDAFGSEEVRGYCLGALEQMGCKPPSNRFLLFCGVQVGSPIFGFMKTATQSNLTAFLQRFPRIAGLMAKIAGICRRERDRARMKDHLLALLKDEVSDPPPIDAASELDMVQAQYLSRKLEGLDSELAAIAASMQDGLQAALARLEHDPVTYLMDDWPKGGDEAMAERIRYNSELYEMLGREDELERLRAFLGEPLPWADAQRFRWLLLTGDGGTGKTRLAMEFVRHHLPPGWVGRRLPINALKTMVDWAPDWLPRDPTLIVIDYPAQRPGDVHDLMAQLHRKAAPHFHHCVRLLLLERDTADSWFKTVFPATADGQALAVLAHVEGGEPLTRGHALPPPGWDEAMQLCDDHLDDLPGYAAHRHALRTFLAAVDHRTEEDGETPIPPRPLFVLAAIEWLRSLYAEGKGWTATLTHPSSHGALLASILERDRQAFWQPEAARLGADLDRHEAMLALASFTLGLPNAVRIAAAAKPLDLDWIFPENPSLPLLKRMSEWSEGRLREREPDLLGEQLIVEQLQRLRELGGVNLIARFCQLAYRLGGDRAAVAAFRLVRDFPEKVSKANWLAPPDGATEQEVAAFAGMCVDAVPLLDHASIDTLIDLLLQRLKTSGAMVDSDATIRTAMALYNKGIVLGQAGRFDDEIRTYDDLLRRFADADNPALQEQVAEALFSKGVTLGKASRFDDEIRTYDDLLRRFADADNPALQEQVAKALRNKGFTLGQTNRFDDEIRTYDDLLRRFADSDDPALQEQVAKALLNKGFTLGKASRFDDAIRAYDDLLRRFADADNSALQEQVAKALLYKGITLGKANRFDDAIRTYDDLFRRFADAENPALQEQVAKALFNKGVALGEVNRFDDAIRACDDLLRRFADADNPALQEQVAKALLYKGLALGHANRFDDAIRTCDDFLRRFTDSDNPVLQELVAEALFTIACAHALRSDVPACIAALERWRSRRRALDCDKIAAHSDFDAIRDHPEFRAYLAQHGCGPAAGG